MAQGTADAKHFQLTVITPARKVYDEPAAALVAPAFDGELGVLPGHAPLMALLGAGPMRITRPDGTRRLLAVRGGFLQVSAGGKATILTPEALAAEDVDAAKVDEELARLKAEQLTELAAREERDTKVKWALTRRKVSDAGKGISRN